MAEEDKFWDRDSDIEREKQPWTWPRAVESIGTSIVFWGAVAAIIYVVLRYG